ncbi:LamG-like jellyroll fold domain-containing protein [Flavobacterium humi]|uniref:T9SS type A sorting domain-containing protein n=1 Tax=Flavobacterium humi TaxID=2562683 RepID=A0A4Z0L9D8_9FLAO|nr:LamG-like jellyroll fold domain-containing protein [Flavobacterium humi]TGD58411.1 T9SS type A sorting domain-containing protein [Flavobacterium humi]
MKTKLFFLVLFIYQLSSAQFPTNGLVAQYGFDNGSLLIDGANGINLTQTGTALTEINNRFDTAPTSAVRLNGDRLTRPDINFPNDAFNLGNQATISFWINTTTNDADARIIFDDSNRATFANANWAGYYIYLQNGKIGFALSVLYNNASLGYRGGGVLGTTVVSDGNWHHVAFTIFNSLSTSPSGLTDTATNSGRLYIDGVDMGSGGATNTGQAGNVYLSLSHDTTGTISIGNNRSNSLATNNRYFDIIDDILIYNRNLTAAEIAGISNYNNFCFTPPSSIVSVAAITHTSATITIPGNSTYDIAYHKNSEAFSNAVIIYGITSGTTNLSGLDIFTNYKVYVKQHCANNTTGWSLPVNFTTTRTLGRIYVNSAASGNNNGISWAHAYTTLENALAVAQDNEEIWIAGGLYKPHASDRTIAFTVSDLNLKLYGGFAGNETQLSQRIFGTHETILSGDLLGNDDNILSHVNTTRNDNSYTVINIQGNNLLLDRLTITGGHANGAAAPFKTGAGITKSSTVTKMTLNNCKLIKNTAEYGGALLAVFNNTSSELIISNCEFSENLALGGGAIYSYTNNNASATYTVSNSLFKKNQVKDNAAALGYSGSSLWLRAYGTSSTIATNISNCTFADNLDTGTFSGINNFNRATLVIGKRNSVSANHTATISNCILWNNKAAGGTVARPISGLIDDIVNPITITNSIDETNFTGVTLSGTSLNTSGSNPLFTNAASGDYTLNPGSPAIDTGNNANAIGTTDLLNNQRVFNSTVDMGAFEFGSTVLGLQSFDSFPDFSIYPNPTSSLVNIESNKEIKSIEVYSLEGKLIFISIENKIDVSNLKSGLYLIKVTNSQNETVIKRLIKK